MAGLTPVPGTQSPRIPFDPYDLLREHYIIQRQDYTGLLHPFGRKPEDEIKRRRIIH